MFNPYLTERTTGLFIFPLFRLSSTSCRSFDAQIWLPWTGRSAERRNAAVGVVKENEERLELPQMFLSTLLPFAFVGSLLVTLKELNRVLYIYCESEMALARSH